MNSEHKRLEGPPCNNPGETAKILRNYKKRYQFCAQNNFRIQSSKIMKERKKRKGKKTRQVVCKVQTDVAKQDQHAIYHNHDRWRSVEILGFR